MCQLCDSLMSENAHHLLFECSFFQVTRTKLWCYVKDEMPTAMKHDVEQISAKRRTEYLLSGLHCDYVQEWSNIYRAIAEFCYTMYRTRRDIQDSA